MIIDKLNTFADNVALNTGAAGSYLLGDQIDLGTPAVDLGHADQVYIVIKAATAITSGGTATLAFQLASDDSAAMTPATASKHLTTPVVAVGASLAAGTVLYAGALPFAGAVPYERWLGIIQVSGVAAITGGQVDAFITKDYAAWKAYPNPVGA